MGNPASPRKIKKKARRRPTGSQSSTSAAEPSLIKPSVSSCDDLKIMIAKRAYELYSERGYRHGFALDDWIEAEREILSQIPP